MNRNNWAMGLLLLVLPSLGVAGPILITIHSVNTGPNDIPVQNLLPMQTGVDAGTSYQATFVNSSGMAFTDYHFDVPPPAGSIGDFVWDDLSSDDFQSDSFFDIFFEIDLDNHLVVDFFQGAGPGIPVGTSYEVTIRNNLADDVNISSFPTVPEPGTLVMIGLGLAGMGYRQRKQVKAA